MPAENKSWVVLADRERGRLLHCGRTELGSAHVDEIDRIEHDNESYEHSRPSPRAGRTGDTQDDHEAEEEARRFARRLTDWIRRHIEQHAIPRLVLYAPPRMLGTLRRVANGNGLNGKVDRQEADLTSLTVEELTRHRKIRQLVGAS